MGKKYRRKSSLIELQGTVEFGDGEPGGISKGDHRTQGDIGTVLLIPEVKRREKRTLISSVFDMLAEVKTGLLRCLLILTQISLVINSGPIQVE